MSQTDYTQLSNYLEREIVEEEVKQSDDLNKKVYSINASLNELEEYYRWMCRKTKVQIITDLKQPLVNFAKLPGGETLIFPKNKE